MKTTSDEFKNFDQTMRKLIKVSHDEIKARLEAEKDQKENAKKKPAPPKSAEPG
jgi:hypothetical protein